MASGQSKGSLRMDGMPLHAIIWITFVMEQNRLVCFFLRSNYRYSNGVLEIVGYHQTFYVCYQYVSTSFWTSPPTHTKKTPGNKQNNLTPEIWWSVAIFCIETLLNTWTMCWSVEWFSFLIACFVSMCIYIIRYVRVEAVICFVLCSPFHLIIFLVILARSHFLSSYVWSHCTSFMWRDCDFFLQHYQKLNWLSVLLFLNIWRTQLISFKGIILFLSAEIWLPHLKKEEALRL